MRLIAATLILTLTSAAAAAPHYATGIKIGEMTQDSAIVWARLTQTEKANWDGEPWPVHSWNKMRDPDAQLPEGKAITDMFGTSAGVPGDVKVAYWVNGESEKLARETNWVPADPARDFTAQVKLTGLQPGTEYLIKVYSRGKYKRPGARIHGRFKTIPAENTAAPVSFTVVTGADIIYPR